MISKANIHMAMKMMILIIIIIIIIIIISQDQTSIARAARATRPERLLNYFIDSSRTD